MGDHKGLNVAGTAYGTVASVRIDLDESHRRRPVSVLHSPKRIVDRPHDRHRVVFTLPKSPYN